MADKKTELMAQFYAECQKKGYTDMTDSVQSLKAKVIATDLKLNYGNIVPFYEKAKGCYEQVQQEKAQAQKQWQLQQQKEEQERIRRRVDGELLVTLSDSSCESEKAVLVRVFIRPDNSVYALSFAGYSFNRSLLNELFGVSSKKGTTAKKLRDAVTHGLDEKAVKEICARKEELFGYMDAFLNTIKTFDNVA